jgi:hypothetical protein
MMPEHDEMHEKNASLLEARADRDLRAFRTTNSPRRHDAPEGHHVAAGRPPGSAHRALPRRGPEQGGEKEALPRRRPTCSSGSAQECREDWSEIEYVGAVIVTTELPQYAPTARAPRRDRVLD